MKHIKSAVITTVNEIVVKERKHITMAIPNGDILSSPSFYGCRHKSVIYMDFFFFFLSLHLTLLCYWQKIKDGKHLAWQHQLLYYGPSVISWKHMCIVKVIALRYLSVWTGQCCTILWMRKHFKSRQKMNIQDRNVYDTLVAQYCFAVLIWVNR